MRLIIPGDSSCIPVVITQIHIHTCVHIHPHMLTYAHMHTHTHTCTHAHTRTHTYDIYLHQSNILARQHLNHTLQFVSPPLPPPTSTTPICHICNTLAYTHLHTCTHTHTHAHTRTRTHTHTHIRHISAPIKHTRGQRLNHTLQFLSPPLPPPTYTPDICKI